MAMPKMFADASISQMQMITDTTSSGPSPRKKIKMEEIPPASEEIGHNRELLVNEKVSQMFHLKEVYFSHQAECFFLENGGQLLDYYAWRKHPTPQLVHFLRSTILDSDDENDDPIIYLKDGKTTEEPRTPGSTSQTHLDTSMQDSGISGVNLKQEGLTAGQGLIHIGSDEAPIATVTLFNAETVSGIGRTTSLASLSSHFGSQRSLSDSRLVSLAHQCNRSVSQQVCGRKSTGPSSSVKQQENYDIKGISTQEAIVERAKQEAQVMSRVAELRKDGLWSSRRLPKVQEPPRPKAHWDYLLEEMQWLAADFMQERKWKKTCARKIAKMVHKHFQDLEQKELRAEKEESMKLKRIASQLAKMIREFWSNIEKVVQYKQNSRLDEKRKKAMDLHLNFIVNQTEQYSNWLSEGLTQSIKGSSAGSITSDPSVTVDDEFHPDQSESDDEETIEKDEAAIDDADTQDEVAALQKESELPIESLIESLPKEILENPASLHSESDVDDGDVDDGDSSKKDDEFHAKDEDVSDVEETIQEQEELEKATYDEEINDLKNEGEMSIDELRAKYAAAYEDDFDMEIDSEEDSEIDSDDEEEDESDEDDVQEEVDEKADVGLEALVQSEKDQDIADEIGPGKELTDIAEQAASLQPKGYTLQTAEVKTSVPFLLKHSLREYQHVGLDWLATMYEKRLNGILADEMGLGKTIQTIALLGHLACEKGIWGPHLIVVPTSVMLNWEMEFKKWCPGFKILTYYGSQKERKMKRTGWTKTNAFHICITSYKLVIQDHNAFRRKKWKYLILDEAQNIKNFKSQRWQCLLNFNSMRRLLLTGTPLQNSLMELWSLMHFLMPHVFQSHKDFKEWFANPLTGMIEGSHEYNENLIRRLHKVLRPFLLRRLKDDVEKQMPKKYEHIVMCHLSKRQRFLYDEFMAQGKTKETLATGHFMSVINILMQLRKVCNHPSLFDPRPIISPFQMEGLVYHTASMVLQAIHYDPLENIDLHRYPGLAEMELDLPAFIAHRVRKLQTPKRLIEEIDIQPLPAPQPPAGKLKANSMRCVSPALQSGRSSPAIHSRSASPTAVLKSINVSPPISVSTPQSAVQVAVLPQINEQEGGVSSSVNLHLNTTQPLTVQMQPTGLGNSFVVPSGQLSQLSVNGTDVVTIAATTSCGKTIVSSATSQVKMSPGFQPVFNSPTSIHLPTTAGGVIVQGQKPVMRVLPLTDYQQNHSTLDGVVITSASSFPTSTVAMTTWSSNLVKHLEEKKKELCKAEFFDESLYDKQQRRRKEKLEYISQTNKQHCEKKPLYGQDLCDAVNIFRDPYSSNTYRNRDRTLWHGPGHIHCHCAKMCTNSNHPKYLWNQTSVLSDIIHTPEDYLRELDAVLDRFIFATPPVQSTFIRMHVSHPPPSYMQNLSYCEMMLRKELSPKTANYHKTCTKMTVQFPELRLIQYDCGKLQTLDILLHRLKSGDHRALIFTQMTRMLDILEAFLNYHGHRYLRLDGTTKIEQRQQLMDRFNADKRIFCFILSTRSGGIGVNLTGADTVIFYDSDWNPTMDAQAQDRCHRIGQTRDVHIYRLVSERTVEENILKKANQKRMLGDMAIEGGNFTTAFFKENTISELFSEPTGLDSLVREKEEEEKIALEKAEDAKSAELKKLDPTEMQALAQFEKALANTEDETDAVAIEQVKAEQKADLAEFDENIPWEENGGTNKGQPEESHVEQELAMLDKELTPIERYAVMYTEQMMEPVNEEELKIAEEDIEAVKKDWELNRLKALKEEEERRAELEEDEMLYTYSRDDAYQQVFLSDVDHERMPLWTPPTPPHDDNDVYIDQTMYFLFEPTVMPETQLPPVYVKKVKKKLKVESITTRKQKQKREEQPRVPRSLFDRANAQLLRMRRDAKLQKLKLGNLKQYRPMQTMPPKPVMEQTHDQPEWLIHEDWALLQAVQSYFDVPLNLMIVNPAHTPNWDLVADVVNSCSRVYRSSKQCRLRYENVIIPREEGRIVYDITPRKQKKQKGIYKMAKNSHAMKTGQIHSQDNNNGITILYSLRFDSTKSIAANRPPTMRQTLVNPTLKNPKHASVLQENNINYEQPLNPMQVAEIRAQRIQREKKQNQQQAAAAVVQVSGDQTIASTTPGLQHAQAILGTIPQAQLTAQAIVAITTGITATQLATIGTSVSSATVLTVTGSPLPQSTIRHRAPLTMQEIGLGSSVIASVPTSVTQVRAQLQTATSTVTTTLNPVQLAQRIGVATTPANAVTVQQHLQPGKTLNPQYLIHSPGLLSRQRPTVLQQQQQQQQLRMQKLTLSHLKTPAGTHLTRPLTKEDVARIQQQKAAGILGTTLSQIHTSQTAQLQSTQIIAPIQQVSQAALSKVTCQQGATLVKTVTAPVGSVTIPANIMPQKGGVAKLSQINPQQMQFIQQRKPIPVQKGIIGPQMLNAVQIIQQQSARNLTVQQLQHRVKQQSNSGLQQIIHTSQQQPTIIATVSQSQGVPQTLTKVIATSATQQINLSSGSGTATLTAVPIQSSLITSIGQGHSSLTASIIKPGSVTIGDGGVTSVQIHPISSLTQNKLTGVAQNVVVTPVQSIQHVMVSAPSGTQAHGTMSQVVVSATQSPNQALQVPAGLHVQQATVQHVTIPQTLVTGLAGTRGLNSSPGPLTVTVTPTALSASPVQCTAITFTATPTGQVSVARQASVAGQASMAGQAVTISDHTVQQQPTVTTIFQSQRMPGTPGTPTIQVQHTPAQQLLSTQTIHIQSASQPSTVQGQPSAVQGQPTEVQSQPTGQGKTTYSMRTRNQSKPQ